MIRLLNERMNIMTIQEQLSHIVSTTASNKIIPFLKSLSPDERKAMVPELKRLSKFYSETITDDENTFRSRGTEEHWATLAPAFFVCYDRKAFEKTWLGGNYILREDVIYTLLAFYTPDWFSDYINGLANRDYIPISYSFLMELADKGYVQPGPEIIARTIPYANTVTKKAGRIFSLAPLEERPVTLDEHIWYLFSYENPINSAKWTGNPAHKHLSWMEVFKRYADAGRLSRERLLKESLAASARNFNKLLSGWFVDLFNYLQPTDEEISGMQPELIAALSSPQSKAQSNALSGLRKLIKQPTFDIPAFLQYVPGLLSSSTKAVQTATLGILQKLGRADKHQRTAICLAITNTFISTDNATQTKAAELIVAYGDRASSVLSDAIIAVEGSLLAGPKSMLRPWLPEELHIEASLQDLETPADTSLLQQERSIALPESAEELIFLISQAMENKEHYHFEQIISGVLKLHTHITAAHISQMEPAFQRAFKLLSSGITGNAGLLDDLLAVFLIEYGFVLEDTYPAEAEGFRKLYEKSMPKSREKLIEWSRNKLRVLLAKGWSQSDNLSHSYEVYHQLVLTAVQQLQQQQYLPLLSMPTHVGGWIDPVVLVERLLAYQSAEVTPGVMDLQVAIARVVLENTEDALTAIDGLTSEYKNLMRFLLEENAMPAGPFDTQSIWVMAGLRKSPDTIYDAFRAFPYATIHRAYLTGQFGWTTRVETYQAYGSFNQDTREYDRYEDQRSVLRIIFPASPNVKVSERSYGGESIVYNGVHTNLLLPEYMNMGKPALIDHDILRLLSLSPANPDILLTHFINNAMTSSGLDEVPERKATLQLLEALNLIKPVFQEITYLFLATAMLNADATNRSMATEIWVDRVQSDTIDSEKLGDVIGTHEQTEWAPLKRLTDLVTGRMQKISTRHNKALEQLLIACLVKLPVAGIKDLRKLLESFHEVLVTNGANVKENELLTEKLNEWKNSASLKKVTAAILSL